MIKIMLVALILLCTIILFTGCFESEEPETTTIYEAWKSTMEKITPYDPAVVNITYEILGSDADGNLTTDDVTKVQRWLYDNIEYKIKEGCNYPNETLRIREGDCADTNVLEYSILIFENNQSNADIYFAYIDLEIGDFDGPHGSILVVFDDYLFLSDPTHQDSLIHPLEKLFKPTKNMSTTISNLFRDTDIKVYDVSAVFSDCCFCSFEDNDEFFEWCDYQLEREIK